MDNYCENVACIERFKNLDRQNEQTNANVSKLEQRITENEVRVSKIDNSLSIKLAQLETKFDMSSKMTSDKIDTLGKDLKEMNNKNEKNLTEVLEKFMEKQENNNKSSPTVTEPKKDEFTTWLISLGKKFLEYGIVSGVIYGILKGLKL